MTTTAIPINIVVEDELSQAVALKILSTCQTRFSVGYTSIGRGVAFIKTRIHGYNKAAQGSPWLVLADLDATECPPVLIADWLGKVAKNHNLLLRIAVREVEAWLLADRANFGGFAGIRAGTLPGDVESISDPKRQLIHLVSKSRLRAVREDIVPRTGTTARQGPNYNGRLIEFVSRYWSPGTAAANAPSLAATLRCLHSFEPHWRRVR